MTTQASLTGQQLVDFLDNEVRSNNMHTGTASSRRSAVREVLGVAFGDRWSSTPFGVTDVDGLINRFVAAHRDDFKPESIQSYRSNFRRTIELCLEDKPQPSAEGWFTYRFPIRDGGMAELRLPTDLTAMDARRLASFITTLPVDSDDKA